MKDKFYAKISGREIISTGSLLVADKDEVEFFPFEDDPDYRVGFKLVFDKNRTPGTYFFNRETSIDFEISRPEFQNDEISIDRDGVNFAEDENYNYWFRFSFQSVGLVEKFSYILFYNLSRVRKSK